MRVICAKPLLLQSEKPGVNNNNEANLARVMANAKQAVEDDVYSKIQMMNKLHPAFHKAC
ncbi:putative fructose-1,6-bisphosphate aldolase [Klebsiella oxytoca]|nr:putative fructose-1,6-bisphosphate aldolase [Klebsiella oxytoca]